MKVSEKDVRYVEDLANLELTDAERIRMVKDLNSILEHIDRLNQLDTTNVPPMAQISDRYGVDVALQGAARFAYAMRDDQVGPCLDHKTVLAGAPDADATFFKVPKVIEK